MAANFDQFLGKCSVLGRVVITHSTYVEGLIPWLRSLASEQGIQTITPAVINRVKGRCPTLELGSDSHSRRPNIGIICIDRFRWQLILVVTSPLSLSSTHERP